METKFVPRPGYPVPNAIHYSSRVSIGIAYFATEEEADAYAAKVREAGASYNGGWFHGSACGREPARDFVADGVKYFAVTD
jgi:hypothetical protein